MSRSAHRGSTAQWLAIRHERRGVDHTAAFQAFPRDVAPAGATVAGLMSDKHFPGAELVAAGAMRRRAHHRRAVATIDQITDDSHRADIPRGGDTQSVQPVTGDHRWRADWERFTDSHHGIGRAIHPACQRFSNIDPSRLSEN
jgi:hypothetical protein